MFDRTKEYGAKLRGEEIGARCFAEPEPLSLEPLPCWKHLSTESYQKRVADLVQQIEVEAAAKREATGTEPLGREAILRQNPETRPWGSANPRPRFSACRRPNIQEKEASHLSSGPALPAVRAVRSDDPPE